VTVAFVGIGSNLEEPRRQVETALEELERIRSTRLLKKSSLYRSAPIGHADQPPFVNAVAALETSLAAPELLAELKHIEMGHGRERSFRNAPRTLDLDLLLHGDVKLDTVDLTLPHPRMQERAFVLRPLLEIAPDTSIPGRGPAAAFMPGCADQTVERMA
jgi:2-amino-4-hydroxy-6-hydroxymethyldihydropteridine diphosphokinase